MTDDRPPINDRAREAFTRQDYAPAPAIEGLELVPLRRFHDDGGSMTELGRLDGGRHTGLAAPFDVAQVNFSDLESGAVKAFHLHLRQTDVWFVPPTSKMLAVVADVRSGSPSEGVVRRFVLGDGTSQLLRIPPGVAHGVRNIAPEKGQLIYFVDRHFDPDPDACDEGRLPWDHFGTEVWEIVKG